MMVCGQIQEQTGVTASIDQSSESGCLMLSLEGDPLGIQMAYAMVMGLINGRKGFIGSDATVTRDVLVAPTAEGVRYLRTKVGGKGVRGYWSDPQSTVLQNRPFFDPTMGVRGIPGIHGMLGMPYYPPCMNPMMQPACVQYSGMCVPVGVQLPSGMRVHEAGLEHAGGCVGAIADGGDDENEVIFVEESAKKRTRVDAASSSSGPGGFLRSGRSDLSAAPLTPPLGVVSDAGAGPGAAVSDGFDAGMKLSQLDRVRCKQPVRLPSMKMSSYQGQASQRRIVTVKV